MLASVLFNGLLGFGMLVAVLFCLGNVDQALNTPTGFPVIEIFTQATSTNAGGTVMVSTSCAIKSCCHREDIENLTACNKVSVVIAVFMLGTIGALTTASRMTWAFARERGLPGSGILARVSINHNFQ